MSIPIEAYQRIYLEGVQKYNIGKNSKVIYYFSSKSFWVISINVVSDYFKNKYFIM